MARSDLMVSRLQLTLYLTESDSDNTLPKIFVEQNVRKRFLNVEGYLTMEC